MRKDDQSWDHNSSWHRKKRLSAAQGEAGFPWELSGPDEQHDGREVATSSPMGKVMHAVRANFGYKEAAGRESSKAGMDPGVLGHQELIKSHCWVKRQMNLDLRNVFSKGRGSAVRPDTGQTPSEKQLFQEE